MDRRRLYLDHRNTCINFLGAICLSEDLQTRWDAKEGKWVLYHREVDKDSIFRNSYAGSLTASQQQKTRTI